MEAENYPQTMEDASGQRFRLLTPSMARSQSQQNERGWIFTLYHTTDPETGQPSEMIVQKVSLADRATLGNLPSVLQKRFVDVVNHQNNQPDSEGRITKERVLENAENRVELANLYVCAGAINPRVYMTQDEAQQFGGVWVGDISVTDRISFQQACERSTKEAAGRFRPYRGRPSDVVEARSVVSPLSREVPFSGDRVGDSGNADS
jgi:hypothetical protein